MAELTCRIKSYIQPFERRLAINELRALSSSDPIPTDGDTENALHFSVNGGTSARALRDQLAYWESVGSQKPKLTDQLRGEATYAVARNGVLLSELPKTVRAAVVKKLPNKRCLRYATHGVHEYRGKFFPQLVRSLLNVAQVPKNGIVLDPMCGSGTTLVEATLLGRQAYGLDINPLSVFIAQVKCNALTVKPAKLIFSFEKLSRNLSRPVPRLDARSYFSCLHEIDQSYLRNWFSASVLEELDHIMRGIGSLGRSIVADFYKVCLSNILREVSWQKIDDLRVRKEIKKLRRGQVIARFLDEALQSTKTVVAFLSEREKTRTGPFRVLEADAREAATVLRSISGKVDAIVTSPPYATALPYLDTDRLSLIYLGLLPRDRHRSRDLLMIGNREITERQRLANWKNFQSEKQLLPGSTRDLIERIDHLNHNGDVGFRRRNLAALLSKYFFDMRQSISQQSELLRAGGQMFMIIGNNRTTAGGVEIEIRTAEHLALIATSLGMRVADVLPMEMLISRDIFRKNTMPSEQILVLRKG